MAGDVSLQVRVSANLDEMRAKMAEVSSIIDTTSSAMKAMANAYDGSKTIANANAAMLQVQQMGGVTKLTDAEQSKLNATLTAALDKYRVLGKDAPAGMQALADATKAVHKETEGSMLAMLEGVPIIGQFIAALSVERLFEFVKGAVEAAGRIEDLHVATGVAREDLQRMAYVGVAFGLGLEEMGRGVEQFSARLANNDKSAVKAVQMLGLNVKELIASGPTEAFLQFADATGQVEDPMMKGAIAADAFGGKLAKVLLPILGDLRHAMADVPRDAIVSDENILNADRFDDSIKQLELRMKSWAVTGVPVAAKAVLSFVETVVLGRLGLEQFVAAHDKAADATEKHAGADIHLTTTAELLQNRLSALRTDAMEPLSGIQKVHILELQRYGVAQSEIAQLVGASESAVHQFTEAEKKHLGVLRDIAAEQKKFDEAMGHLNSVGDDWHQTLDKIDGSVVEAIKYYIQAGVSQTALATAYGLTSEQVRAIADARKEDIAVAEEEDRVLAAYHQAEIDRAHATVEAYQKERDAIAQVAAEAKKAAEEAKKARESEKFVTTHDLETDAGRAMFEQQNPELATWMHEGYSYAQALLLQMGHQWNFPVSIPIKGPRVPGFERGVEDFAGGLAMVGERGPEMMYVPPHANIYPHGSGPGGNAAITVNITVKGNMMGTHQELARVTGAALMKTLNDAGFRAPTGA